MKILVTGGSGFIGSAVIRAAVKQGHQIVNLDALTYAAGLNNLTSVESNPSYTFIKGDIRDINLLSRIFNSYRPDSVMHLAAESHVDRSIDSSVNFVETNISGTYNMLESFRKYWQELGQPDTFRFHHVSTDEVFGSLPLNSQVKFTESTPYNPRNPYSASKASSDHLVRAWRETYGLPIIITNSSNNFGPYQFPEKLIPVTILNALNNKKIPIYGAGHNVRDWLYVVDHAEALLSVIKKGKVGTSYNIGAENELTNLELVHKITSILESIRPRKKGAYADLIAHVKDRPGHDERYAINPNKINNELNWHSNVSLDQGLNQTVHWYVDNESWWRPLIKSS